MHLKKNYLTKSYNLKLYCIMFLLLLLFSFISIFLELKKNIFFANYEIIQFRTNKIIIAILTGAILSITGASLQALLKNPLADPYMIGISGGGVIGSSFAIILFEEYSYIIHFIASICGTSLVLLIILFFLLKNKKSTSLAFILLIGISINSFAASIISLLKILLSPNKVQKLTFLLIGTLNYHSYLIIILFAIVTLIGITLLIKTSGILEIMQFGDEEAISLGINTYIIKIIIYICSTALIGFSITLVGIITFIGLVVPHIIKKIFYKDMRLVIPISAIMGSIVMVILDLLSKIIFPIIHTQLPIGTLSALIGAPIFIIILFNKGN